MESNDTTKNRFDEALFLDNDAEQITRVGSCARIEAYKVPDTDPFVAVKVEDESYQIFLKGLSSKGVEVANILAKIAISEKTKTTGYDPASGINGEVDEYIRSWLTKRSDKRLAILIDFDRTLSKFEGLFLLGKNFKAMKQQMTKLFGVTMKDLEGFTLEAFTEYYMGGLERLMALQSLFDFLYEKGVTPYLLTNNSGCVKHNGVFADVLSVITKGRTMHILCGMQHNFDKKHALERQTDENEPGYPLHFLCQPTGGSRKTKRHRNKKQKTYRKKPALK